MPSCVKQKKKTKKTTAITLGCPTSDCVMSILYMRHNGIPNCRGTPSYSLHCRKDRAIESKLHVLSAVKPFSSSPKLLWRSCLAVEELGKRLLRLKLRASHSKSAVLCQRSWGLPRPVTSRTGHPSAVSRDWAISPLSIFWRHLTIHHHSLPSTLLSIPFRRPRNAVWAILDT